MVPFILFSRSFELYYQQITNYNRTLVLWFDVPFEIFRLNMNSIKILIERSYSLPFTSCSLYKFGRLFLIKPVLGVNTFAHFLAYLILTMSLSENNFTLKVRAKTDCNGRADERIFAIFGTHNVENLFERLDHKVWGTYYALLLL